MKVSKSDFTLVDKEVKHLNLYDAIMAVLKIQTTSGANAKKAVIQQYAGDTNFERLLYYALNPMLTYKISERTILDAMSEKHNAFSDMDIFDLCEYLAAKRALDDQTVYLVADFISNGNNPEYVQRFYIQLLSKTLRLGVTAKTVNKVIPGLIPEWEVQQAYPIEKYPLKPDTEFWLTQKLNGTRATYYKGKLYARSGVPYEGLNHIERELELLGGTDVVFDGELTLLNRDGLSDNEAFRVATGIINSDAPEKPEICYTVFDIIYTSEFEDVDRPMNMRMPYSRRRKMIDYFIDNKIIHLDDMDFTPIYVNFLPVLYHGTDQSQIDILLDQMVCEDKEGLMVNLDVPYQRKRHRGILKVKRFYTMDLPIIGCEEGSGRLSGALGALVVDYKGNELRVGSGFTDVQREGFWAMRSSLPGTLCEVKYKELSYDKKTGAESLQFPIFVRLRNDKEDISYG